MRWRWIRVTSGVPGKRNYNRCLWSATSAIACGQGILWFLATDMMDRKTLKWTPIGKDKRGPKSNNGIGG